MDGHFLKGKCQGEKGERIEDTRVNTQNDQHACMIMIDVLCWYISSESSWVVNLPLPTGNIVLLVVPCLSLRFFITITSTFYSVFSLTTNQHKLNFSETNRATYIVCARMLIEMRYDSTCV